MIVSIFSTTFVWNVSRPTKKWVQCPLFSSDFNETWIISTDFRKIFNDQISYKFFQWEPSCSMRTKGRTDIQAKLVVAFRNFAYAPQNIRIPCLQPLTYITNCVFCCVFVYVRITQHTCKYIYPIQGYMFRLSRSHHQAFLEHKT
jgi:hypothetical protein